MSWIVVAIGVSFASLLLRGAPAAAPGPVAAPLPAATSAVALALAPESAASAAAVLCVALTGLALRGRARSGARQEAKPVVHGARATASAPPAEDEPAPGPHPVIVDAFDLSPADAENRLRLTQVLDALPALSAQLDSLTVHLVTTPDVPWPAFRADEGASLDVAREALRGLEPLVTRAVVALRGSPLPFVVFSRTRTRAPAAPPPAAWHQLTGTLCRALPLFTSVEVHARGRPWRVIHDSTRGDAADLLASLGALGPGRVEEVRARTPTQALASLYQRHAPTTRETSTWKELVDAVHAGAGSLRQLDLLEDDDAGPWRRLFRAHDPRRAEAIAQRLPNDPALVRVVLAGTRSSLTLSGPETDLVWALDELAPFAAEIIAMDADGLEQTIYAAVDEGALVRASEALLSAGHARVARLRAAWDDDEPFVLYERASLAATKAVAPPASLARTRAVRRTAV